MKTPPIYVINLKRNPERRLFIQRQLDALNLNYQFVDAIDQFDLESSEYRAQISCMLDIDAANLEYKYSRYIHKGLGQLTCLLSHIKAYNLMLENNDDIACVLEDDAILLPTFPTVLNASSKFSWDILMLSSQSITIRNVLDELNRVYKRIIKYHNRSVLIRCRAKKISYIHKHITKLLGIPPHLYPKQSKAVMKILEDYRDKYKDIIKLYNPQQSLIWVLSATTSKVVKFSCYDLLQYTGCQLGGLPVKHSRQAIDSHHCIAEPAEKPTSAMAYLVKQSTTMKWKRRALAKDSLAIDETPWELYKNERVKLRLITPPCVTATYNYLVYSARRGYAL